jgi:hypothetical protein
VSYILKKRTFFLIIGINTVARKTGQNYKDYLTIVLQSLISKLDLFFATHNEKIKYKKRILVFVQDNTIESHPSFDKQRDISNEYYDIIFFKNEKRFEDPFEDDPNHNYLSPHNEEPGHKARQQTCDVISMVRHVMAHFSFQHFMFMEDDFLTCSDTIPEMLRILDTIASRTKNNYCMIKIAYGMSGVILNRENLDNFITYTEHNIDQLPIDNIIQIYAYHDKDLIGINNMKLPFHSCATSKKNSYSVKKILQEHIGSISTFEERNKENFRPPFSKCNDKIHFGYVDRALEAKCDPWSVIPCNIEGDPF